MKLIKKVIKVQDWSSSYLITISSGKSRKWLIMKHSRESVSRVLGPLDHDVLTRGRAVDMSNSLTMRNKLKRLLNFAKQYLAVLRNNNI